MNDIVYHRRGLSWLYWSFVPIFAVLGVLLLMVSLGVAVEKGPWSGKWLSVVGWGFAGLSWLLGIPQMRSMAKQYSRNEVRLTASGFSLYTPQGHDLAFAYTDVRKISWNPQRRARRCTIETDSMIYRLDARICPHTHKVAMLIAERSGQQLRIATE